MGGMLPAILLTSMLTGMSRRIVGLVAFAVTGGLVMTAALQFWLRSLGSSLSGQHHRRDDHRLPRPGSPARLRRVSSFTDGV
jgi:hypothetical protein